MGRWKNIKYEDRICKICDQGVESENHFVFFCSLYSEERGFFNRHLASNYNNWYNLDVQDKLKILMKSENVVFFVKYLHKVYQKRKIFFESK